MMCGSEIIHVIGRRINDRRRMEGAAVALADGISHQINERLDRAGRMVWGQRVIDLVASTDHSENLARPRIEGDERSLQLPGFGCYDALLNHRAFNQRV